MKVLFYNTRLHSLAEWGGDTTQMMETQKELEKLGVQVSYSDDPFTTLDGYDVIHIFNLQAAENGIDIVERARRARLKIALSSIWWDFSYLDRLRDSLLFSNDIVIKNLSKASPWVAFSYLRLQMRFGRKSRKRNRMKKRMLEIADVVLPNSYAELEILVQDYDMPALRAKAVIVPNAVTPLRVPEGGLQHYWPELPGRYILEAAKCHPAKGQMMVIRALMEHREIPIVFAGSNFNDTEYGRRCQEIGNARGNTFFLGKVNQDHIPLLYSHAGVHALPSLRESPGLASLEAAVYGANCVISFHCPVAEYFASDAWVCDPENLESVRDAILKAWQSEYSNALRERILTSFTWRKAAEFTLHAYRRIVKKWSAESQL